MSALTRVLASTLVVCVCSQHGWSRDSPRERYTEEVKATQLNAEGKAPFHLRIAADLYDLSGTAHQSATIEEWWASPHQWRIEMKGAGVDDVQSSALPPPGEYNRARYLLQALLGQVVHPLALPSQEQNLEFEDLERTVAGVKLHCLTAQFRTARQTNLSAPSYCLGSGQELLLVGEGAEVAVRHRMGKFHDADVGLRIEVGFNKKPAIDGTVVALEGFDPAQSKLPEFASPPPTAGNVAPLTSQAPLLMGGKKLSGSAPTYPLEAKREHIQGTVVLCALISVEGKISSLDVVASPSNVLTRAAKDAVKTWLYTPYEIDGKAAPVTTSITVNFNIG